MAGSGRTDQRRERLPRHRERRADVARATTSWCFTSKSTGTDNAFTVTADARRRARRFRTSTTTALLAMTCVGPHAGRRSTPASRSTASHITSASNTVEDVIPGVTLTLKTAGTTANDRRDARCRRRQGRGQQVHHGLQRPGDVLQGPGHGGHRGQGQHRARPGAAGTARIRSATRCAIPTPKAATLDALGKVGIGFDTQRQAVLDADRLRSRALRLGDETCRGSSPAPMAPAAPSARSTR